jgi:hypothetical protein
MINTNNFTEKLEDDKDGYGSTEEDFSCLENFHLFFKNLQIQFEHGKSTAENLQKTFGNLQAVVIQHQTFESNGQSELIC